MSNFLFEACKECLAEKGRGEETELAQKVYDFIHTNFEEQGKSWNYTMIESVIDAFDATNSAKNIEFRNLDGVYFRVERNNKWQNICFSDLTEEEMEQMIAHKGTEWLKSLCITLGKTIRKIGDHFDIRAGDEENDTRDS